MRAHVLEQGEKMLTKGIETQSASQLANALQILHNMNQLEPRVERLVAEYRQNIETLMSAAFTVPTADAAKGSGMQCDCDVRSCW